MEYYGMYQGLVTSIKDPAKRGRIKLKCPDVLGADAISAWADPVVPVAYDNGGDFCLPEIGEMVWVMFIGGDPNEPVYLGGWWQDEMTPLGASYANSGNVRVISYADCRITMKEDTLTINVGDGETELSIKDGKVTVKGNLTVDGNIRYTGTITKV